MAAKESEEQANHHHQLELLSLPDELLLSVSSFAPPKDLLNLQCVCSRLHALDTDFIWQNLCKQRWQNWPRYKLTPSRLEWMDDNLLLSNWKERFLWAEEDFARTKITREELEELDWSLNFTAIAGGRGEETTRWCKFRSGFLLIPVFMPLPYEIYDEKSPSPCTRFNNVKDDSVKTCTEQWLKISNFDPHHISRSTIDGEWIITNNNVTIVSNDAKSGPNTHSRSILLGT
uniref:F-box domain-containing protein n=1 Tax=Ditylum brightwellii TaxID=49249 RepID=A0A7S4SW47_9STRA|mmetsp:Transcript_25950/g.38834  ORF Transcript_25950/g.38834 Transcript_25950/m.38834 type:complete len:231 (+) Transcript_25950:187-879(+)